MRLEKASRGKIVTITLVAVVLVVSIAVLLLAVWNNERNFEWNSVPNNIYPDTLIAAADMDYPPFSFIDKSGVYSGHDVELIYAVANEMQVNIDLRLLPWSRAKQGLLDGEIDILLGMTYNPSRLEDYEFTNPIIYEPYVAFGRDAESITPRSMVGSRLCTLEGDSIYEAFLIPYSLLGQTTFYATYTKAFQSVADGINDYVVAPYTTGSKIIEELGLKGIAAGGPELNNSIYCMSVKKGHTELVERLNTTLITLEQQGTLDSIHNHWLVKYAQPASIGDIISNNRETFVITVLALCLLLFLLFYAQERHNERKLFIQKERARILEETSSDSLFELNLRNDRMMYSYKDENGKTIRGEIKNYMAHKVYQTFIHPDYQQELALNLSGKNTADDTISFEYRTRFLLNDYEWHLLTLKTIKNSSGSVERIMGRRVNIEASKQEALKIQEKATMDFLTNIYNRETFLEESSEMLLEDYKWNAVIMLDVDEFKHINDNHGHAAGDEVLRHIANLLQRVFNARDVIGRFGGDEFMVYMNIDSTDVVALRLEQFRDTLRKECEFLNAYPVTCSVGAVCSAGSSRTVEELMQYADDALYAVKQGKKDGYLVVADDKDHTIMAQGGRR